VKKSTMAKAPSTPRGSGDTKTKHGSSKTARPQNKGKKTRRETREMNAANRAKISSPGGVQGRKSSVMKTGSTKSKPTNKGIKLVREKPSEIERMLAKSVKDSGAAREKTETEGGDQGKMAPALASKETVEELRAVNHLFSESSQSNTERLLLEVLNTEGPCCFLSIMPEKPKVFVVRGLATFSTSPFGSRDALRGRVLGLKGNTKDLKNANIIMAPENGVADRFFSSKSINAMEDEDLREAFRRCPKRFLCPPLKKVQRLKQYSTWKLIPIPPLWALQLPQESNPFAAYKIIADLVLRLPKNERQYADHLLIWLRAACCAKSCDRDDSETSQVSLNWTEVVAPCEEIVQWAQQRTSA
jgi:hypothetical protein